MNTSQTQLVRSIFGTEQAYASNAIEGSTLTLKETQAYLAYGITARGKPLKDHLEATGHQAAMTYVYELVDFSSKRKLTEVDIRQLHVLLFEAAWKQESKLSPKVGTYKSENNHVLTKSGRIHYYADANDVPQLMNDFVSLFNDEIPDLHPIEACAMIHHKFTAIHPFADGNGRVARILANLYLLQKSWPPFVIYPDKRDAYYLALERADAGDNRVLYKFFEEAISKSLDMMLKILRKKFQSNSIKHNIYHKRVALNLTQKELAKKAGISQERISKIENNSEHPSDKTLLKLAKALKCSVMDL